MEGAAFHIPRLTTDWLVLRALRPGPGDPVDRRTAEAA